MFAGQPGLEPRPPVLETGILPIKLLTYTCTIHHIRTVPMSPKLCYFTFMSGAEGEDTRGKGWSRTTIIGFSVRCIDLLCYLPILRRAEVSNLIRCRTHNLADWFLAFRIYSPFKKPSKLASYGLEKRRLVTPIALPRGVLPPVALPLMAPHGRDPFGVPTRFMELTVYLRFPRLHVRLFRNYTYTYLQRYWVALYSV